MRAALAAPDRLFDGYALDLDGTVYLGDAAPPGAVEAIRRLRELDCGMAGVLVLSGVTGRGDLERSGIRPRYDDLTQLLSDPLQPTNRDDQDD
jgi:hypothetical protein